MTKKKRGAPLHNRNALKHGFYSAAFRDHERRMLARTPPADLTGEIDLIRVANRRFLEALNVNDVPLDVDTQLAALRALNLSAQSIIGLIRTQVLTSLLAGDENMLDFVRRLETSAPGQPSAPSPALLPDSSSDS